MEDTSYVTHMGFKLKIGKYIRKNDMDISVLYRLKNPKNIMYMLNVSSLAKTTYSFKGHIINHKRTIHLHHFNLLVKNEDSTFSRLEAKEYEGIIVPEKDLETVHISTLELN